MRQAIPPPSRSAGNGRVSIRLAEAEFHPYIRTAPVIVNMAILIFVTQRMNPMKRRPVPSPAIPLIARFGLPDRRKSPPARRHRQVASKRLI
jgi:hypothetical protein